MNSVLSGTAGRSAVRKKENNVIFRRMVRYKALYLMLVPALVCVILFNYAPIGGLMIAFKDYNLTAGVFGSPWIGFENFRKLFSDPTCLNVIKNTVIISMYKLICGIPFPIFLAVALNEVKVTWMRKTVQTVSYLPHFISWVVVAGMVSNILSPTGIVAKLLNLDNVMLMTEPKIFRGLLVITEIWKEAGWNSVIYMAALSGIDVTLYEAASMDGASRMQRIRHITLPSLTSLVVTVTILACGNILNAGFDQVFNMQNSMVQEVSDIIDTYVYRMGIVEMSYSFSSAVGLFKSVTGLIMLITVNTISRKLTENEGSIW
ncbi:MAG: sugar ABC transporter permease [Clostridia bacterium]|nr:sugar ABC transporter permease [Clostridia bacterium]